MVTGSTTIVDQLKESHGITYYMYIVRVKISVKCIRMWTQWYWT